ARSRRPCDGTLARRRPIVAGRRVRSRVSPTLGAARLTASIVRTPSNASIDRRGALPHHLRMVFHQFNPAPPLDRFIANFWYWKGDPLPHSKELIMASPTMGLLINLHEDALRHYEGDAFDIEHRSRGIALSGANTQNFAIDAVQPEIM